MGKEQGQGIGVLDAMHADMRDKGDKNKCSEVKGWLRRVGPCCGLRRGNWSERGDVM